MKKVSEILADCKILETIGEGPIFQGMICFDSRQVEEGDIVRVARAPFCAHLVTMSQGAFYRQLDSRLGFGKRFEG